MHRREFLGRAALAAASLPACSLRGQGTQAALERTRASKKVIVIGAGLAGLAAGYELAESGHDVTVLEAQARCGGRVSTLRAPFSEGLYADAGALFIPNNHDLTLRYIRHFKLTLQPSTPAFQVALFYVRGRRIVGHSEADSEWPFDLTAEERRLGRRGMWEKYLGAALEDVGDVTAPGWLADHRLEKYDRMSVAEFLRSRGASPDAVSLLRLGYLDRIGDGIESYSALQMLHGLALRRTETTRYAIKGGTDLLPNALAASLGARIRYQAPVTRIEPGERSASVIIRSNGENQRLTADHVVCTVPFSVLKHMEVAPPFSSQKTRAIHQLPYTSVAGIFLQFKRKVWTTENLYISADVDGAIKWLFEHTVYQPGPRGVLEAQATGAEARGLTRMTESDRIRFALEETERVHPGIRLEFERGTSKCWDEDPWARGAFPYFRPGEMLPLLPHLGRAEGRVHFAGEHTSRWSGWMQGALESGLRVAREINPA